jgi:hypothetical protein
MILIINPYYDLRSVHQFTYVSDSSHFPVPPTRHGHGRQLRPQKAPHTSEYLINLPTLSSSIVDTILPHCYVLAKLPRACFRSCFV